MQTRVVRTGKMVETKLFHVFKRWKETRNYVNSETGAGLRGDEQSWQDMVMARLKY